jgi:hypothetical protein
MLIATIAAMMLLFGGGDSLENYLLHIKKPVKAAVVNKATKEEVIGLSKELGKQLEVQNKEIVKLRRSFLDLHTKYDATSADLEAHIDKVMAAQEKGQAHILDTQSAMKNLMTREEWTEVFSFSHKID